MIVKTNTMFRFSTIENQRDSFGLIFRFATFAVALIGACVQIYQISNMYFRYSTTTDVRISVETEIDSPALSICIYARIDDSDDDYIRNTLNDDEYEFYHSYKNGSQFKLTTDGFRSRATYFSIRKKLLTLKKALTGAPRASVTNCGYRDPIEERKVYVGNTGCDSAFDVKKYVTEDFVCYRFQLSHQVKYGFKRNMEGAFLSFPGFLYAVRMSFNFSLKSKYWSRIVLPYLHPPETYGAISRLYPVPPMIVGQQNFMQLTYARYAVTKLPRPYYTKCRHESAAYSQVSCVKKCRLSQMNGSGYLPYTEEFDDDDLTSFGNLSLGIDPRLSGEQFRKSDQWCDKNCDENCYDEWYISSIRELKNRSYSFPNFSIPVLLPNRPFTTIEHRPQLVFNEYVIYVMSVFGTWFGICFLDLNPFKSKNGAKDSTNMGRDNRLLVQDIKLLNEKFRTLESMCNQLITNN